MKELILLIKINTQNKHYQHDSWWWKDIRKISKEGQ